MNSLFLAFILACTLGLEPINDICPGGSNCWCAWDTGHDHPPPLDELGHIICDTGSAR